MPKTILVTGAAGFIGFHVAKALLDRGDTVVGYDNMNNYYDVKLKEDRLAQIQDRGHENSGTGNSGTCTRYVSQEFPAHFTFYRNDLADYDALK